MKLILWSGLGAGSGITKEASVTLSQYFEKVQLVNNEEFFRLEDWETQYDAIAFGGGYSSGMYQGLTKYNNEPIERIQKFVANGGTYLGFCAGAYFATMNIEFEKGGKYEKLSSNTLKLYNGKGIGAVYPGYHPEKSDHDRVIPINFILHNNQVVHSYYYGGGYFTDTDDNYQVVATYADFPDLPAIVYGRYGRGTVFLSGVHLEVESIPWKKQLDTFLSATKEERKQVFERYIGPQLNKHNS